MPTLNISYLSGELIITILVKENATVNDIKRFLTDDLLVEDLRVEDGTEREYRNVSLMYQNNVLSYEKTISEYNIIDNSTLTFVDNTYIPIGLLRS